MSEYPPLEPMLDTPPNWDEPPLTAYEIDEDCAVDGTVSALDQPIAVTFFADRFAKAKSEAEISLRDLVDRIRDTTAGAKAGLPWLKLANFGELLSDKDSLRHDANVLAISGIECDYDGEQIAIDDAIESLTMRGIAALVYTSPSHTPDTPRWRVLCPCSRELSPDQRSRLLARLNGVLGGVLSRESFTLSQSYFYGSVNRSPSHEVHLIDGQFIDLLDDLDAGAIGKPVKSAPPSASAPTGAPSPKPSDRRLAGYIDTLLANVRNAVDGDKHFAVLRNATALGGVQAQAGSSDAEAIEWIIKALRDGGRDVKDWDAAATTAGDGLAAGRKAPIDLGPDRERPAPQADVRRHSTIIASC